jgi:hypothetical protein
MCLSACDSEAKSRPGAASETPILLTFVDNGGPSPDAGVSGDLGVNRAGCFALNDKLLVGPPDSSVDPSGEGITLKDVGHFQIGDSVQGAGGYVSFRDLEAATQDRYRDCLGSAGERATLALLIHRYPS